MNDDQLRDRLARLDPGVGEVTTPYDSAHAQQFLEQIMQTDTDNRRSTAATDGASPAGRRRGRVPVVLAGAAAAVVAVAATIVVTGAFDDDTGTDLAEPVELSLGEGEDPLASCIRPDATVLAPVPLAFAGTATEVEGERVVLDVTRWYAGTDEETAADTVELTAPAGLEALTGGITFEIGQPYLVSATNGVVNYCGLSGPATPELQAIYDGAFGAAG